MESAQVAEKTTEDRSAYAGVLRYYELAKRAEWQVRDLPWNDLPPIPEYKGTPQKLARWRDLWRSVVTQQLQADELAVEMATQLFRMAPEPEAKLYYTTMVQDESRHTEAWLRLVEEAGGRGEQDPYLDQLAELQLKFESIEEKVVNMGLLRAADHPPLPADRPLLGGDSARGPVQSPHRGRRNPPRFRNGLRESSNPKCAREDEAQDRGRVEHDAPHLRQACTLASEGPRSRRHAHARHLDTGVRLAHSLGLDVSDVALPF